jgi:phenylacetate-CoA ligase
MIFQYNPLDYYIQTSQTGELVYTVTRQKTAAPKVRYNLRDIGGVISCAGLLQQLKPYAKSLPSPKLYFPILYVYGRGDQTVPFYGAKIFATDLDTILHETPELVETFNSFQISTFEDEQINRFLAIAFELKLEKWVPENDLFLIKNVPINQFVFEELKRVNQDFREVSKMFTAKNIIIELHSFGTGPFKDRDIRIKQKYIKDTP